MIDPNNRPGGPNLILTAKSANKIQFFDAATLAKTAELDMPASTHEMIRSPDGNKIFASVYGGGIFGKNFNPDRLGLRIRNRLFLRPAARAAQ